MKMFVRLGILLCGCATTAPIAEPQVPANLRVPAGNTVVWKASAKGVQIYSCKTKAGAESAYEWALKGPEAELSGERGESLGRHYDGPTWEANDGSKITGKVRERAAAPSAEDVPWLLLAATPAPKSGVLGAVTFVQRIGTHGGKAPAQGCDGEHVGAEARVDYTATYYFFGAVK
jgi:hypothetical protein